MILQALDGGSNVERFDAAMGIPVKAMVMFLGTFTQVNSEDQ